MSSEKIILAVDERKDFDLPERVRLVKLANSATFDRMDRTLQHLKRVVLPESSATTVTNLPLVEALLGLQTPTWTQADESRSVKWFDTNINDSQKEAVRFCLDAEHVACIHGPPGVSLT